MSYRGSSNREVHDDQPEIREHRAIVRLADRRWLDSHTDSDTGNGRRYFPTEGYLANWRKCSWRLFAVVSHDSTSAKGSTDSRAYSSPHFSPRGAFARAP